MKAVVLIYCSLAFGIASLGSTQKTVGNDFPRVLVWFALRASGLSDSYSCWFEFRFEPCGLTTG